ncbi:unnamed protein product [Symbiodinium natans]|uniref:Uncharacterized protein n=1 Tax=Symbiodinium natans TaxID=878477 RepID=A0A812JKN5_9DINO|nr:unnamed protein product [Symbiodinium natans]
MNSCNVDLHVEQRDRSDRAEALSSPSSSRSSDSNYLDQESRGRRPVRPPRPALLGRDKAEEPRHAANSRAGIAEEHPSISLRHSNLAPCAATPQAGEAGRKPVGIQDSKAKGVVGALGNVVQDQLQMKYGLAIELDDFTRKVESLCRAQLGSVEDLDSCSVATCVNNLKEMRFRTRDGKRSMALQLEPHVLETFEELLSEATVMTGTACAIATVYQLQSWRAVAVFRQDYARPAALVGKCSDISMEPLIAFTAQEFRSAVIFNITVTEVLNVSEPLEPGAEVEPVPSLRDEYLGLRRSMAQAVQFQRPAAAPQSPAFQKTQKVAVPAAARDLAGIADFSRHGLGDALLERRAAEAAQPSVMSMAMDWLWSRGQPTWLSHGQVAQERPRRTGGSAPPSSRREAHHSRHATASESFKLDMRKVPYKSPCAGGRFGCNSGQGRNQQSSSRPSARPEFVTPAPLTMAGLGPATLSRADSPETPPAARMRQEAAGFEHANVVLSPPEADDARRRRGDSRTSLNWGFCS